ncbi:MAG: energy transducer TonB [Bdellovibrionales bacterium]|nr:energy transducer TonB [Bdellovibrionales bacterium]
MAKDDVIEVTINPQQGKQIAMFAEAPEIEVIDKKQTPFLSKKWQRVSKETIARKNGPTENRSPREQVSLQKNTKQTEQITDPNDLNQMVKPKPVDLSKLGGLYAKTGDSSSGERLFKDIDIGDFNSINTDEYTFYSFHERINDRIRIRWVNRIEDTLIEFKRRGVIGALKKGENTTMIEIRLDKDGNYLNSVVIKSSGIKSWDEAAVLAFQTGAPFLNPPTELVEKDGIIHLQYRFSVMWDPKYIKHIN